MRIGHKAATILASAAMIGAALVGGAPSASATDSGGNGNPATDCPNGSTVASTNIYDYNGAVVGLVEMRWSAACSGNWTRVTSKYGAYHLEAVIGEGVNYDPGAVANDIATQNFTPYLRVAPSQYMCSLGTIAVTNDIQYTAQVCSN
ncbi:hypothetical protein P3T36_002249 [Kitasatospora sp. MAP12-15]|uniref:hypothetical protein n=1 Tax=unclassified Kitasatospora TaxID=2633591 RepID=UPI00247417DB|nr:hypothetical protein [Kitasatospora sp. MAP12-44]MDH6108831.1 hypothetical protein [Kitasatospora sp. MAP12-44]